jgi:DNA mismatch endonuclease (patch repair protein)
MRRNVPIATLPLAMGAERLVIVDPIPSSAKVSARMARHPRRDTLPELAVRRALHRRGLRYRVDVRPDPAIRRRADVVFMRARVAVFIDGCYWHGCPTHCRPSGRNVDWWRGKIDSNRRRDAGTDAMLAETGWTVIRAWAHDDPESVADSVERVVRRCGGQERIPPCSADDRLRFPAVAPS